MLLTRLRFAEANLILPGAARGTVSHSCPAVLSSVQCSATKEAFTVLQEPIRMSLDDCLEYVADDELIEVSGSCQLAALYDTEQGTP